MYRKLRQLLGLADKAENRPHTHDCADEGEQSG